MNVCSTGTIVEFVVAVDMKNLRLALKTQVSDSLHDTYSTKYSYIWLPSWTKDSAQSIGCLTSLTILNGARLGT